jgi:hypothetical protein
MRSSFPIAITAFVTCVVFASGCSSSPENRDEATGSTEAALRSTPGLNDRPPPPSRHPWPPPPPPTDPFDPLYVRDAGSTANILFDEQAFYAHWFEYACPLYGVVLGRCDDLAVQYIDTAYANNKDIDLWKWGSQAAALVQMYDLVAPIDRARARKYLSRLRAMAHAFLRNRDDQRGAPVDPFRGRVMPAWGLVTKDRDGQWNTDVVLAGFLTYAMAAFGRRIAENPSAFPESEYPGYQADAVRFINATMETYEAFRPEMHLEDGDPWAYYTMPEAYATLTCPCGSDWECVYKESTTQHSCRNYRDQAGSALAWNENFAEMRALAEVAIAADTPFFRARADDNIVNAVHLQHATKEAPVLVAKNFEFFYYYVTKKTWSDGTPYVVWNHQYWGDPRVQDTTHGSFELASIATLYEDQDRLNTILANEGRAERLAVSPTRMRPFATTFLRLIWKAYDPNNTTGSNLLGPSVDGSGTPTQYSNNNEDCAGFVTLTVFDSWVWTRCRDVTYHFRSAGAWVDLYVQNHAALLRYRPRSPGVPRYPALGDAIVTSPGPTTTTF